MKKLYKFSEYLVDQKILSSNGIEEYTFQKTFWWKYSDEYKAYCIKNNLDYEEEINLQGSDCFTVNFPN